MAGMSRPFTHLVAAVAASLCLALLVPALASARLTELGGSDLGTPSCPSNPCLAITRTTGFQMLLNGRRNVFMAPRTGWIVAFTIALGKPTQKQIDFFNQQSGGKASARIAILKQVPSNR